MERASSAGGTLFDIGDGAGDNPGALDEEYDICRS